MDLILCHTTADFDTLGAAVGMTQLLPGARIVLTGGAHPAVRDFLALHRDEYPLIERRAVKPEQIRTLVIVDAQQRSRLGKSAEWLDLPQVDRILVYDHHLDSDCDLASPPQPETHCELQIEAVGATTTLIVEKLRSLNLNLDPFAATVMALGIHVDTGSLTFAHSTPRDAEAIAWLMRQGAHVDALSEYIDPGFSTEVQGVLSQALEHLGTETYHGQAISRVLLPVQGYIGGLSSLASELLALTASDGVLLGVYYPVGEDEQEVRLTVIGRSQIEGPNLGQIFQRWGGGGHAKAAAMTLRGVEVEPIWHEIWELFHQQIPEPLTARDLMSSPVRTVRPDTLIEEAQRILLRYGHSGLSVVNDQDALVGIISRRDLDLALHHGFGHAPVKGYMSRNLKTIAPEAGLPEIEQLMVTYDVGRLPVLEAGHLIGIVTRTDVLRTRYQGTLATEAQSTSPEFPSPEPINAQLKARLLPQLWHLLETAAAYAHHRGWHLYLVGGGVRDLLLADPQEPLLLSDVDLVVDGFHHSLTEAAGVELATALQQTYPAARLEVHGKFQTAALLWHNDPMFQSLWIDVATSRTEFYPYPAANPEVEASSIRQDLYRRDFTINALALQLTPPRTGALLDFFGGLLDLRDRLVRVLHANSFIEDPTRIYRAVRFAVRLGFAIEPQTREYITYALDSGVYERIQGENAIAPALQTRLRAELEYILEAGYWQAALKLLGELDALRCLHPTLHLTPALWKRIRLVNRGIQRVQQPPTETPLTPWRMRLEVLLAELQPDYRGIVAHRLQLPADSIRRLEHLATAHRAVLTSLQQAQRPSQIYQSLLPYDVPTLMLIAAHCDAEPRRQIWQYLTRWMNAKPPLDGTDLKAMGYKPGKQFKVMLDWVMAVYLDEELSLFPTELKQHLQQRLQQHYPL